MRIIKTFKDKNCQLSVYYHPELEEYVVKPFCEGKPIKGDDGKEETTYYYTDDKTDAFETAKEMLKAYVKTMTTASLKKGKNMSKGISNYHREVARRRAGSEEYTYRIYASSKKITLKKRGREVTLSNGDKFGYRMGSNKKVRVVVPELGPNIIFSFDSEDFETNLLERSIASRGRKPGSKKPASKPASKPDKKPTSRRVVKEEPEEQNTVEPKGTYYAMIVGKVNPSKYPQIFKKSVFFVKNGRFLKKESAEKLKTQTDMVLLNTKPLKSVKMAINVSRKMLKGLSEAGGIKFMNAKVGAFEPMGENIFVEVNGKVKQNEGLAKAYGKKLGAKIKNKSSVASVESAVATLMASLGFSKRGR